MEEKSNQEVHILQNIENKKNVELKTRKKLKGYCRFLRNIIKEKSKSMKEIIQKRFIKWRKDALKGKIKKTVMIRISVSKEKEPKNKYQISKANPKEQSRSVNKNELKSFNINNIQRNITNLKVQKVDDFIKEDNKINSNKMNVGNKYNNIEIKSISNNNANKDKKEKEEKNMSYKQINAINKNEEKKYNNDIKIDLSKYDKKNINNKNKITNKNENPIINTKAIKLNSENFKQIPKPNQNNIKNKPQEINKKPISNISNINVVYTSSTKKNNPNEIKNKVQSNYPIKNYQTDIKEKKNNYKAKNQTDLKDKIPKVLYRKYEGNDQNNSRPVNNIKIDLTKDNHSRQTFNRHINNNSYGNLSYEINQIQNKNLYNNNTYQGKNNNKNNNGNIPNNKYSVKTDIYNNNNDSSSLHSRSRKDSNKPGTINIKKISKGGITTVIQHYSGQRRKYDNYDNNTHDINKNKK